MRGVTERIRQAFRKLLLILGIRNRYRVEILLLTVSLVTTLAASLVADMLITVVIGSATLAIPVIYQYVQVRQGVRDEIRLPFYAVVVAAIEALIAPPLAVAGVILALLSEDITPYFQFVTEEVVAEARRVMFEPLRRRELAIIVLSVAAAAVASYYVTKSPIVFAYPIISYILIVYSIVIAPDVALSRERAPSIIEELSRRLIALRAGFLRIYSTRKLRTLGKEAGFYGVDYETYISKASAIFALATYVSLLAGAIAYPTLGISSLLIPLFAVIVAGTVPALGLAVKKSSRASTLNRNILMILVYITALKSVAETFTNIMYYAKTRPQLAKVFGILREAQIYYRIYLSTGIEQVALQEYLDGVPHDFYRDTLRTAAGAEEAVGPTTAYKRLLMAVRDYSGRWIDAVRNRLEKYGDASLGVAAIINGLGPVMVGLNTLHMLPLYVLIFGIISLVMAGLVSVGILPDLPSEYIHAKRRYRWGAVVFAVTGALLATATFVLLPEAIRGMALLATIPAAFGAASWYVVRYDRMINEKFLDKLSDIMILFASSVARHGSVPRALLELSESPSLHRLVRNEMRKLARIFKYYNVENINYRGPYWYKFFLFMATIAATYGSVPRDLYEAVSRFSLEFKRLISNVKSTGWMVLILMQISFSIALFMSLFFLAAGNMMSEARAGVDTGAGLLGQIVSTLPSYTPDALAAIAAQIVTVILLLSTAAAFLAGRLIYGTARDGRFAPVLFLLNLVLVRVIAVFLEAQGWYVPGLTG